MTDDEVIQRENNEPKPGGITGKGFVKGDPRINRRGRPRTFDALRKLAIKIAGENVPESEVTRIEALLRVMSSSRNPADRALFLAYAYGKPKEQIEQEIKTEVTIKYAETGNNPAKVAPSAGTGQSDSEEV